MDYTTLITSGYRNQPKFLATVALLTSALSSIGAASLALTDAFSVDHAVGVQLDQVGLWVGIGRAQRVPIPNAFFSFGIEGLGWNQANWKGPYDSTEGITLLDDDTYRAVLRSKIASNYWLGSNEALEEIGNEALSDLGVQCFVVDNFDMSITIYILGAPSAVLLEMIKRGVTPPKPGGVRVAGYILASDPDAPFFALDVPETDVTAGLDFGSFGNPV